MAAKGPLYHPVATGSARTTVDNHTEKQDLIFWAGWFCPFTQRTWIVLEEKKIPYTYLEVNPYLKESEFISISPNGLVPAIQHHGKPLYDSIVISEYLEEAFESSGCDSQLLLPATGPYLRGKVRIWVDYINNNVVPAFFRLLQAQPSDISKRTAALKELNSALAEISSHREGLYFFGDGFSLVDAAIAPWAVRDFIVRDYRGFSREEIPDWKDWAEALECRPSVVMTSSDRDRYVEFNKTFLSNESHSLAGNAARQGRKIP